MPTNLTDLNEFAQFKLGENFQQIRCTLFHLPHLIRYVWSSKHSHWRILHMMGNFWEMPGIPPIFVIQKIFIFSEFTVLLSVIQFDLEFDALRYSTHMKYCVHQKWATAEMPGDVNRHFFVSKHLPKVDSSILVDLNNDYCSDFIIDPVEVANRLAGINIFKAPGPDGIPNWLLRDFASYLCKPLTSIFNASIREGFIPLIWKSAEVIAVPKIPRPRSIQTDLRPISLLPIVAKVLESLSMAPASFGAVKVTRNKTDVDPSDPQRTH